MGISIDVGSLKAIFTYLLDTFFLIYGIVGDFIYEFYVLYSRAILNYSHIFFDSIFNFFIILTVILATFYLIMAIALMFKRKKHKYTLEAGNEPVVTVQIPTYNELAAINCAKRCIAFDYPKNKLQIIIGDDSSDKAVSAKISQFASKYKNILITRRGKNIGFKPGNLNHMLKYTKGEFIVIFDSDFLPDPQFLRRIIAPFIQNNEISVVQSRWRLHNFNQNIISVLGGTISLLCHNIALSFIKWFKGNTFLCGSAEAIRKRDLLAVGGWKTGSLTEDIECSLRLIQKGKRLIYLEDLECDCEVPYTFKDLCKQQMRWAYGVITALKQHFPSILKSKSVTKKDKLSVLIFASGYMFSFLLLGLTAFGILSVVSNAPAPVDWIRFFSETGRNIALTSGFLISSVFALVIGNKAKDLPRMIAASLSVGLAVTYYVNVGILKAFFKRDMHWFMLNKNGNKQVE